MASCWRLDVGQTVPFPFLREDAHADAREKRVPPRQAAYVYELKRPIVVELRQHPPLVSLPPQRRRVAAAGGEVPGAIRVENIDAHQRTSENHVQEVCETIAVDVRKLPASDVSEFIAAPGIPGRRNELERPIGRSGISRQKDIHGKSGSCHVGMNEVSLPVPIHVACLPEKGILPVIPGERAPSGSQRQTVIAHRDQGIHDEGRRHGPFVSTAPVAGLHQIGNTVSVNIRRPPGRNVGIIVAGPDNERA